MWLNYLRTASRSLLRTRAFSVINLIGLAIGMAIVLIVAQYVRHELTYDRNWVNGDRIAQVLHHRERASGETRVMNEIPENLSEVVLPQIPGVEASSRIVDFDTQVVRPDQVLRGELTLVEPAFFDMFKPVVLEGNPEALFPGKENVVLTRSAANKYFGERDPLGQLLELNLLDVKRSWMVTGVIEDFPEKSVLSIEMLAPYENWFNSENDKPPEYYWVRVTSSVFVMLQEGVGLEDVQSQIASVPLGFDGEDTPWGAKLENYRLQSLHDIHVSLTDPTSYPTETSAASLRLLVLIGLVILMLACVNFTTLSIGQAATRLREVGVRKVLGARRGDLLRQFWVETALLSFLALLIAVPLVEMILPGFRSITGVEIHLQADGLLLLFLVGIWFVTVLAAGAYPALAMSGFSVVSAMKGEERVGGKGTLRRVLVFIQLTVAAGLMTATFVMMDQMQFIQRRDLGFQGEQVVLLDASTDESLENAAERLRIELAGDPGIQGISQSDCSFKGQWTRIGWSDVEAVKNTAIFTNQVDPQYKDVMQLDLAAGRWFRQGDEADRQGAVVINETLANMLGGNELVGKTYPDLFGDAVVVGIVKDFHFHDLTRTIEPLVMMEDWDVLEGYNTLWIEQNMGYVYVRLAPDDIPGTMNRIHHAWADVVPEAAFEYQFLQDEVDAQYRDVARWNKIMLVSSGLAILIAVLGLIGISAMQVARRTREIGIRKVLGATIPQLLSLLSKEVLWLVALANLIAWPAAWWLMKNWLQNFAYRMNLGWQPFVEAGVLVLLVALATVSLLSIRVANINPVKSLRSE